jgi:hypothetical protein
MTDAERAALLDLAHQMRGCIPPGDALDPLWEWVWDLERCAQGLSTVRGSPPQTSLILGHRALTKRRAHAGL